MKKLILILSLLIVPNLYASEYMVENPDGTVQIHVYVDGARKSLAQTLIDTENFNKPVKRITKADYPSSKEDRKYWRANPNLFGDKMVIDAVAKQADIDKKNQEEAEADQILNKMCPSCSREEFKKLVKRA